LFWFRVSEALVHGHLGPIPLGLRVTVDHGGSVWQRRSIYLMVARKQREEGPGVPLSPSRVHA
jgi:hypothetical protein